MTTVYNSSNDTPDSQNWESATPLKSHQITRVVFELWVTGADYNAGQHPVSHGLFDSVESAKAYAGRKSNQITWHNGPPPSWYRAIGEVVAFQLPSYVNYYPWYIQRREVKGGAS